MKKKMNHSFEDFLKINFWQKDYTVMLEVLKNHLLNQKEALSILSINPEIWMRMLNDNKTSLIENNIVLPDGIGICMGYTFLTQKTLMKRSGSELIFQCLNKGKFSIFLLGSTKKMNQKAQETIKKKFPNCQVVGGHSGYFDSKDEAIIIKKVLQSAPALVLCALGYPKQENLMAALSNHAKTIGQSVILIACGGMIDVLAGDKPYAPQFWRKNHL